MHIPVVGVITGIIDLIKNIKNAISNDGKIDGNEAIMIISDFVKHVTGIDLGAADIGPEKVAEAKAKLHL